MIPKTLKAALICVIAATPLSANDDFVKGLIGGIVGAAIVNGAKA